MLQRLLLVLLLSVAAAGEEGVEDQSLGDDILKALQRAPPQCREKFFAYHTKQSAGLLKTHYELDPTAGAKCSKEALMVGQGKGAGTIMKLPNGKFEAATHHALYGVLISDSVAKAESLAFLIIAHDGQTVAYLSRLIGVLNKPGHFVMVHVDAKARRELHDLVKGLEGEQSADYGTVRLVTPAVQVSWAGPSMLHAMLLGLRQLDELSSLWGHVIVISGSDFPVKPVDHMAKLLRSFGPSSHFEMFLQLPEFARARGLDLPWVECENFVYKVHSSRPQIEGIDVWGGSSWITLSHSFTKFLVWCLFDQSTRDPDNFFRTLNEESVPSICSTATNFLDYSENMLSAEEIYFHTVYMNSPHCQNLDTRYLRWVHWLEGREGTHCGDLTDWCGKSPGYVELRQIRQALSLPAFFVRKVDPMDTLYLDYLEARLANDTRVVTLPFKPGKTTSSSFEKSMPAMHAIDKNDYTRWASSPGNDVEWFEAQLQDEHSVCGATIVWELARAAIFDILVKSSGAKEWEKAYSFSYENTEDPQAQAERKMMESGSSFPYHEPVRYEFERPMLTRHVIIKFQKRATTWGYSIFEFELHACGQSYRKMEDKLAQNGGESSTKWRRR